MCLQSHIYICQSDSNDLSTDFGASICIFVKHTTGSFLGQQRQRLLLREGLASAASPHGSQHDTTWFKTTFCSFSRPGCTWMFPNVLSHAMRLWKVWCWADSVPAQRQAPTCVSYRHDNSYSSFLRKVISGETEEIVGSPGEHSFGSCSFKRKAKNLLDLTGAKKLWEKYRFLKNTCSKRGSEFIAKCQDFPDRIIFQHRRSMLLPISATPTLQGLRCSCFQKRGPPISCAVFHPFPRFSAFLSTFGRRTVSWNTGISMTTNIFVPAIDRLKTRGISSLAIGSLFGHLAGCFLSRLILIGCQWPRFVQKPYRQGDISSSLSLSEKLFKYFCCEMRLDCMIILSKVSPHPYEAWHSAYEYEFERISAKELRLDAGSVSVWSGGQLQSSQVFFHSK